MRQAILLATVLLLASCVAEHRQPVDTPEPAPATKLPEPAPKPDTGNAEVDAAFAWFDTLGFPNLGRLQFVKIATGGWTKHSSDDYEKDFAHGFLLSETPVRFRVLSLTSLTEWDMEISGPDVPKQDTVYFTRERLEVFAREQLEWHRKLDNDTEWDARFKDIAPLRAQYFVLARACDQAGFTVLARELAEYTLTMALHEQGDDKLTLRDIMERELGHATAYADTLACGYGHTPRTELLRRFERFVKFFPSSRYIDTAKEMLGVLRQMVGEDEEHAAKRIPPLSEMPVHERTAELIFMLRDQEGGSYFSGGSFTCSSGEDNNPTPAAQLEALGYDAVPQLIEALDDKRLTRIVVSGRYGYFNHWVERVGAVAAAIVAKIAGSDSTWGPGSARTWWQEFQEIGEEATLVKRVSAGEYDAPGQARRLVAKYPASALAAIKAGLATTKHRSIRSGLVECACKLDISQTLEFLHEQLIDGSDNDVVAAAASGLYPTEPESTMQAVIERWRAASGDHFDVEELVHFLGGTKRAGGVEALGDGLLDRTVDVRFCVMQEFATARWWNWKEDPPELALAIEHLLARCLEDQERYTNCSMGYEDFHASDPRVCDFAVFVLHEQWPDVYAWRADQSTRGQERMRIVALNRWREKNGQALLPVPPSPDVATIPDEQLQPLYDLAMSSDSDKRKDGIAALEARGIGAYAFIAARLKTLDAKTPGYPALYALAQRLACTLLQFTWAEAGPAPSPAIEKALSVWNQKPLSYKTVRELIVLAVNHLPEGATGISISIERDANGGGMEAKFEMLTGTAHASWMDEGWALGLSARNLGSRGRSTSGSAWAAKEKPEEGCESLREDIEKMLNSAPDEPFSLAVSIVMLK
ncbi:MAG: hypothetical protein IT461_17135 [Planctomycetes bacterium]|nr:hypothetical protein [Planctomycetota bacterium]